jgi:hypothetical protein
MRPADKINPQIALGGFVDDHVANIDTDPEHESPVLGRLGIAPDAPPRHKRQLRRRLEIPISMPC